MRSTLATPWEAGPSTRTSGQHYDDYVDIHTEGQGDPGVDIRVRMVRNGTNVAAEDFDTTDALEGEWGVITFEAPASKWSPGIHSIKIAEQVSGGSYQDRTNVLIYIDETQ